MAGLRPHLVLQINIFSEWRTPPSIGVGHVATEGMYPPTEQCGAIAHKMADGVDFLYWALCILLCVMISWKKLIVILLYWLYIVCVHSSYCIYVFSVTVTYALIWHVYCVFLRYPVGLLKLVWIWCMYNKWLIDDKNTIDTNKLLILSIKSQHTRAYASLNCHCWLSQQHL